MAGKIFISYSRLDRPFANRVADDLRAARADIWIDQRDIRKGARWDDEVGNALRTCERMVLILSPASMASQNVKDELADFLDRSKQIIPILFQPCEIDYRIKRFQFVDVTASYEDGITQLLQALGLSVATTVEEASPKDAKPKRKPSSSSPSIPASSPGPARAPIPTTASAPAAAPAPVPAKPSTTIADNWLSKTPPGINVSPPTPSPSPAFTRPHTEATASPSSNQTYLETQWAAEKALGEARKPAAPQVAPSGGSSAPTSTFAMFRARANKVMTLALFWLVGSALVVSFGMKIIENVWGEPKTKATASMAPATATPSFQVDKSPTFGEGAGRDAGMVQEPAPPGVAAQQGVIPPKYPHYLVVSSSFVERSRADAIKAALEKLNRSATIRVAAMSTGAIVYSVQTGPFATKAEADSEQKYLDFAGVPTSVITVTRPPATHG